MNRNRSLPFFNNKALMWAVGLFIAFIGLFSANVANAQASMTTTPVCAGTCPVTTPPNPHFGATFSGSSWSAAVNAANAMRGDRPISGTVVQEFAESGSRTSEATSIGMDIRVTGFQPGSTCEADCNSSRVVMTGMGNAGAEGFSMHFMRTEGSNGGPAAASSYGNSGSQTAIHATGTVTWLQPALRQPLASNNPTPAPTATP